MRRDSGPDGRASFAPLTLSGGQRHAGALASAAPAKSHRWDGSAWEAEPDGNGEHTEYEERVFLEFADAERWVRWQLSQWPTVVMDNGYVLDATAELQRVVFPPRMSAWPHDAMYCEPGWV